MSKLKTTHKSTLLQTVETILDKKKKSFKALAKELGYKEVELVETLNQETWPIAYFMLFREKLAKALGVDQEELVLYAKEGETPEQFFTAEPAVSVVESIEEKVRALLRKKSISFVELAQRIGFSNAGLHRSFSNNTISVTTLESIAKELDVDVSYFFENIVVEKMVDEILRHNKSADLKNFMFGFSRDVSKGMSVKDAVYKNIDPEGYKFYLVS